MDFSSWGGKLRIPLHLQQGPQGTSCVASGELGLLSSCQEELGLALESLQGNWASSLVEVGNSGFLLSCDGDLRETIGLPQGIRPPFEL